eukprot:MONOS_6307.1-p1 / transcript=MONOS_6307.1 / gene=MONOS_6307 / organism=Monocercomonoides_exilis_PA203 / gene_product=unspecified product / transcript_product=unspecified product / location=Mono_scaffold00197:6913-10749(+) / protein_length=1219 / sequence_SO=supercontig / SO=protein_coding / is_pseudo=false
MANEDIESKIRDKQEQRKRKKAERESNFSIFSDLEEMDFEELAECSTHLLPSDQMALAELPFHSSMMVHLSDYLPSIFPKSAFEDRDFFFVFYLSLFAALSVGVAAKLASIISPFLLHQPEEISEEAENDCPNEKTKRRCFYEESFSNTESLDEENKEDEIDEDVKSDSDEDDLEGDDRLKDAQENFSRKFLKLCSIQQQKHQNSTLLKTDVLLNSNEQLFLSKMPSIPRSLSEFFAKFPFSAYVESQLLSSCEKPKSCDASVTDQTNCASVRFTSPLLFFSFLVSSLRFPFVIDSLTRHSATYIKRIAEMLGIDSVSVQLMSDVHSDTSISSSLNGALSSSSAISADCSSSNRFTSSSKSTSSDGNLCNWCVVVESPLSSTSFDFLPSKLKESQFFCSYSDYSTVNTQPNISPSIQVESSEDKYSFSSSSFPLTSSHPSNLSNLSNSQSHYEKHKFLEQCIGWLSSMTFRSSQNTFTNLINRDTAPLSAMLLFRSTCTKLLFDIHSDDIWMHSLRKEEREAKRKQRQAELENESMDQSLPSAASADTSTSIGISHQQSQNEDEIILFRESTCPLITSKLSSPSHHASEPHHHLPPPPSLPFHLLPPPPPSSTISHQKHLIQPPPPPPPPPPLPNQPPCPKFESSHNINEKTNAVQIIPRKSVLSSPFSTEILEDSLSNTSCLPPVFTNETLPAISHPLAKSEELPDFLPIPSVKQLSTANSLLQQRYLEHRQDLELHPPFFPVQLARRLTNLSFVEWNSMREKERLLLLNTRRLCHLISPLTKADDRTLKEKSLDISADAPQNVSEGSSICSDCLCSPAEIRRNKQSLFYPISCESHLRPIDVTAADTAAMQHILKSRKDASKTKGHSVMELNEIDVDNEDGLRHMHQGEEGKEVQQISAFDALDLSDDDKQIQIKRKLSTSDCRNQSSEYGKEMNLHQNEFFDQNMTAIDGETEKTSEPAPDYIPIDCSESAIDSVVIEGEDVAEDKPKIVEEELDPATATLCQKMAQAECGLRATTFSERELLPASSTSHNQSCSSSSLQLESTSTIANPFPLLSLSLSFYLSLFSIAESLLSFRDTIIAQLLEEATQQRDELASEIVSNHAGTRTVDKTNSSRREVEGKGVFGEWESEKPQPTRAQAKEEWGIFGNSKSESEHTASEDEEDEEDENEGNYDGANEDLVETDEDVILIDKKCEEEEDDDIILLKPYFSEKDPYWG